MPEPGKSLTNRPLAAHLLQVGPSKVSFAAGCFTVGTGERGIDLLALAEAARETVPDGMIPGLDAEAYNASDLFTFPSGFHAAEVEIDPETGVVGLGRYTAIDLRATDQPDADEGAVQGGLAQGIGQALFERTVYDAGSGQLLSGSFILIPAVGAE
jgi:carbon-monoxide dehydrogenase large subunit